MVPRLLLILAVAAPSWACSRGGIPRNEHTIPDPELTRLFEEDQASRSGPLEQVDMAALNRQDSTRRQAARGRAKAGALRTALDYYHAAMIFQHGLDSTAYALAHRWATQSQALDSTNLTVRWLVAATWDRYQMSRNLPQWYGTQTDRMPRGTGRVVLYTIDTTHVTDAERQWRGVGTLAELRTRLDMLNKRLGLP